jgi:AbrB family looped-hinge helix DNA binding protein
MAATLSSKYQIVIPTEARKRLKLKAGDKLEVVMKDGMILLFPTPKSWERAIRGIAKGAYPDGYLEKERSSWD